MNSLIVMANKYIIMHIALFYCIVISTLNVTESHFHIVWEAYLCQDLLHMPWNDQLHYSSKKSNLALRLATNDIKYYLGLLVEIFWYIPFMN